MALTCPQCDGRLTCYKTESKPGFVERWYKCPACGEKFKTQETMLCFPYLEILVNWLVRGGVVGLFSQTGRFDRSIKL